MNRGKIQFSQDLEQLPGSDIHQLTLTYYVNKINLKLVSLKSSIDELISWMQEKLV